VLSEWTIEISCTSGADEAGHRRAAYIIDQLRKKGLKVEGDGPTWKRTLYGQYDSRDDAIGQVKEELNGTDWDYTEVLAVG